MEVGFKEFFIMGGLMEKEGQFLDKACLELLNFISQLLFDLLFTCSLKDVVSFVILLLMLLVLLKYF